MVYRVKNSITYTFESNTRLLTEQVKISKRNQNKTNTKTNKHNNGNKSNKTTKHTINGAHKNVKNGK